MNVFTNKKVLAAIAGVLVALATLFTALGDAEAGSQYPLELSCTNGDTTLISNLRLVLLV